MSKNVTWTREDELSVRRLTTEEKRWITRLARVLSECPDRIELLTYDYNRLDIIDKYATHEGGVVLASITGPTIHGVSG